MGWKQQSWSCLLDDADAHVTHYALKFLEEYAFCFSDWGESSSLSIALCAGDKKCHRIKINKGHKQAIYQERSTMAFDCIK